MRIAIPSDDGTNIAAHTGRASGFVIFDVKDSAVEKVDYRTNSYTGHAKGLHSPEGGHHQHQIHSHNSLLGALEDCNVFIANGMGPRLIRDLEGNGIQVVFCRETVAEEAARQFAQGKLDTSVGSSCDHRH